MYVQRSSIKKKKKARDDPPNSARIKGVRYHTQLLKNKKGWSPASPRKARRDRISIFQVECISKTHTQKRNAAPAGAVDEQLTPPEAWPQVLHHPLTVPRAVDSRDSLCQT